MLTLPTMVEARTEAGKRSFEEGRRRTLLRLIQSTVAKAPC